MDIGRVIKNARTARGLNQAELAENICTQATISNLESNIGLPSIKTLIALSDRLDIDFNDLMEFIPSKYKKIESFKQERELLRKQDYAGLEQSISKEVDLNKLILREVKEYRYLMGMVALYRKKNYDEALFQLNLGLQEGSNKKTRKIEMLILNGIGMTYFENNEVEKSAFYIKKALNKMNELTNEHFQKDDIAEFVRVYSTTANYYSYIRDFKKANSLYMNASDLQKEISELVGLDTIYYERGVNFAKMGDFKQTKKMFLISVGIAEINSNMLLIDQILASAKKFGFDSINYEK